MVTLSTLDPRTPLVLGIRELERRPGEMKRVKRVVPAPSDLELSGVVGVSDGAGLELDLRLESVMEGVLVSGTAQAPFAGECVRCLDAIDGELTVDIQELYAYPDRVRAADADRDVDGEAERVLEDEMIDLEPALRDVVVLALPQTPLCRDECPGLCPRCGARLADDPAHEHHETTDPRWAALAELRITNEKNESGSLGAGPTEES